MTTDQFSDPALGHLTRYLEEMPSLEEYVKTASMDADEINALPEAAFGWPEERKFPLHSAEHAALSYAYCKYASALPVGVLDRVKQAVDLYGIPEEAFDVTKTAAAEEDPSDWLCPDLQLFSVKTAAEFKAAQTSFLENYEKLDFEHRSMASQKLAEKAEQFKQPLEPLAVKVAGLVVSHIPTLKQWVSARAEAAIGAEYKDTYTKLAEGLDRLPPESTDRPALLKLATALAELDQRAGLEKHYDRRLPDPLLSVFNTTKEAAESLDIAGTMIPVSKLASLPASFWSDLGGQELADEIAPGGHVDAAKLATVVETLPMDLKTVIRSQLRG